MEKRQLNHYCRLLNVHNDIRMSIADTVFELQYQFEDLKKEIITNKISLKENGLAYLILVEAEIKRTISHLGDDDYEKNALNVLKKFNIKIDDFLNHKISNEKFEDIFRRVPNYDDEKKNTRKYKEFINYYYDFYFFLVIKYANIVVNFVKELKGDSNINVEEPLFKPNQLTANQIVILLDRLGFLAHPDIEDLSRSKQAELISIISGLNKKNFEKYIDKLEDSKPTKNYQKDIKKIDKILDDLI